MVELFRTATVKVNSKFFKLLIVLITSVTKLSKAQKIYRFGKLKA